MRINVLKNKIHKYYSGPDPAHDWAHVLRVLHTATQIAQIENANIEIVQAAVLCHDLVNVPKDDPRRSEASTLSAHKSESYLKEAGFTQDEIELIKTCIIEHSFSKGLKPSLLESQIVQDADRLDALGAIGILRCAATSTKMKSSFYHVEDPWSQRRIRNDKVYMLDHYEEKLFKLPELMNTRSAKSEGEKRVQTMKNFLKVLNCEINLTQP